MIVTLEVIADIEPTKRERAIAVLQYQPTPESPTPDDEWICEEVALRRVSEAFESCLRNATVTDVS